MKVVRLGNVIVTAGLAAAMSAFFILALDPILKRAIIKSGETALGARVSVASVKTKIFQGKISISGLTVADSNEPMKNLFEVEKIDFQILTKPLLEKKLVIEESSLSGLAFNTPRQSSGALPKKLDPQKLDESSVSMSEKMKETWGQAQSLGIGNIGESQNSAISNLDNLKPENLASLKILDEGQSQVTSLESTWKEKMVSLKSNLDPEPVKKQIQEIKSSNNNDPVALAANLKKLKELKNDLNERKKVIKETKNQADQDFASAKAILDEAKKAKAKDLASLKSLSGIPNLDPQSIATALLGPVISKRVSSVLGWIESAKKYMPKKGETSKKESLPQKRGVDVLFPKKDSWPTFLWKHALVAGQWPSDSGVINFSGEFKDFAFEPAQWTNPFKAEISGDSSDSSLKLNLLMDHRSPQTQDELIVTLKGQPVKNIELGNPDDLAIFLTQGEADLDFKLLKTDLKWQGRILTNVNNAQMQPKSKLAGQMAQRLTQTIAGIKEFKIEASFEGEPPNVNFDLKSDLGSTIAASVKNMLQGEIDRQQKALEAKVDALYKGKADALEKMIDQKKSEILGPLAKYDSDAETLLKEASKPPEGAQSPIPTNVKDLKKLFK